MRLRIICTSAGNFEFTYTSAGNFYAQVLVNAYTEFYIPGKYIPLTKTIKNRIGVISYHKKITATSGCNFTS